MFIYNLTLICGAALFVLSPIGGLVSLGQSPNGWAAWLMCSSALVAIFATIYRVYFQRTLAEAALIAGMLNAATVAVLIILFS